MEEHEKESSTINAMSSEMFFAVKKKTENMTVSMLTAKVDELLGYCLKHPADLKTAQEASIFASVLLDKTNRIDKK